MISFQQARDIVAKFSYKPDWTIELRKGVMCPVLVIDRLVHDSDHPERPREEFRSTYGVPDSAMDSEDVFIMYVREQVIDVELHECDEFLRIGGVRLRNPHP